jgi:hypothetical protein
MSEAGGDIDWRATLDPADTGLPMVGQIERGHTRDGIRLKVGNEKIRPIAVTRPRFLRLAVLTRVPDAGARDGCGEVGYAACGPPESHAREPGSFFIPQETLKVCLIFP